MTDLTDFEAFDPPTEWTNYGDTNPERHGGIFVRWTGETWKVVSTTPADELRPSAGASCSEHRVQVIEVSPGSVWPAGDPNKGYTDKMRDEVEALESGRHGGRTIPSADSHAFLSDVTYYVAGAYQWPASQYHIRDTADYDDGYAGLLASFGVDPDEDG